MDKLKIYEEKILKNTVIPTELYEKYDVKKGLRDITGKGVMAGLTTISNVQSYDKDRNQIPGILEYRTYNIKDIINHLKAENRFGFEEVTYLLLFGELPTKQELDEFNDILAQRCTLPQNFVKDIILASPSKDIMNSISRCLLAMESFDENAADVSIANVLDQSLDLIAKFPLLAMYAYHAYNHSMQEESLHIHYPDVKLSTAENVLRLLRPDKSYTDVEAKALDIALILHMEHGGGNNSTFTTHVVTSSGSDTYATTVAAMSSLKGPKHGGANIKASELLDDLVKNIHNYDDENEIRTYLTKILNKEAFDKQGLIYGFGHAVYTISDPRFEVFKSYVEDLSNEKGLSKEYALFQKVEKIAPEVITAKHKTYKTISPNVDLYSGFVYKVLGIPEELYTALFAIARIVGWSAHRMEELINMNKIIRPAYASVAPHHAYIKIADRG